MQLDALGKSFDNYCQLCQEQEAKLDDLQKKRFRLEIYALINKESDLFRSYLFVHYYISNPKIL